MAPERPIRRKPCSHAYNFESLIAFRNIYVWGGGRDGGRRGWGRFQWFSGCNMLTVIFFLFFFPSRLSYFSLPLSLSLSLSLTTTKKKKQKKNTHAKFLCIFLRNTRPLRPPPPRPPPHPTRLHTQMVILSGLNTSLSSRWWCWGGGAGGVGAWPQTGYRCLNKRGDEMPLNSVLQPWTFSDFFH